MKAITVESVGSELVTRTLECLVLEEYIRTPNEYCIRIIAKVKPNISEERLVLSGLPMNLKYIIVNDLSDDPPIIRFINNDGSCIKVNEKSERDYLWNALTELVKLEIDDNE